MVSISTGPLLGEYSVTGEFCRQKADNIEFLFFMLARKFVEHTVELHHSAQTVIIGESVSGHHTLRKHHGCRWYVKHSKNIYAV